MGTEIKPAKLFSSSLLNKQPVTLLLMQTELPTFAERLVYAMDEKGISPADLAKAVKVTPSAVSQWRSGQTKNLRPDNLFKVADILGVNARWLATGMGPVYSDKDYNLALSRMSEENRRHAEAVITAMEDRGSYKP